MTDEPRWRDNETAIQVALFRYGIIAPILEVSPSRRGEVTAKIVEIAARSHYLPGRGPIVVKPRTIYEWLAAYRRHGIKGLRPCWRKDRGARRVLKDDVLDRAIELRKENPRRKGRFIIDDLVLEKRIPAKVPFHRSTLDRHLALRGASRRYLKVFASAPTIKMEFENFGDFWVGDYHQGPLVRAPDDKVLVAKIGAFIDHATRYPVSDRYYLEEDLDTLRDSLLRALLRWGAPKLVYVDRAKIYKSDQLEYSLHRVKTQLVHSRAYYSKGRGVIERWWQLLKDFESEVALLPDLVSIHQLNSLWEAFRERHYCQHVHSEIGKTPATAIAAVTPRGLDPEVARELFLVKEERKVHQETSCVSVKTREFLCESYLRRQWVDVRFDPNDLSSVVILKDGRRIQRAFPRVPNTTPAKPPKGDAVSPSVNYLALVREEYDRQLLEMARPLAYAKLKLEPEFDLEKFLETISGLAGLSLQPAEKREAGTFWESFGPLPEDLVRIGTEHAVRLSGRRRHVRVYLAAIRTLVLAHWRDPHDKEMK